MSAFYNFVVLINVFEFNVIFILKKKSFLTHTFNKDPKLGILIKKEKENISISIKQVLLPLILGQLNKRINPKPFNDSFNFFLSISN